MTLRFVNQAGFQVEIKDLKPGRRTVMTLKDKNGKLLILDLIDDIESEVAKLSLQGYVEVR